MGREHTSEYYIRLAFGGLSTYNYNQCRRTGRKFRRAAKAFPDLSGGRSRRQAKIFFLEMPPGGRYAEAGFSWDLRSVLEKGLKMSEQFKDKIILVVDDDADVLITITTALATTGAKVLSAPDGNTAVEIAEREQPDLIILDMMLPKRSGFLVLERIKARKPRGGKPHVIMITGNLGTRHKTYAESLGVEDYLNKPFRMDRLLSSMERLLNPPAEQ